MEENKIYDETEEQLLPIEEEEQDPKNGDESDNESGHICSICGARTDSDAAVLTISGYAKPRYICGECEALLDTATLGDSYELIAEATEKVSDRLTASGCEDAVVLGELSVIFKRSAERAKAIKDGTYDFSEDTVGEVDLPEEVPEELTESEEDRLLDEKEAKANRIMDSIFSWVAGIIFFGAVVYFIIRFIL